MGVNVRSAAKSAIQSRAKSVLSDIETVRNIDRTIARIVGPNADPNVVEQLRSLRFRELRWRDRLSSIEGELGINDNASTSMGAIGTNRAIEAQMAANEEYIAKLERDIIEIDKRLKGTKRSERKSSKDNSVLEVAKKELSKVKEFSKRFKLREDDSEILSKEDIMNLNHEDRARMLDDQNKDSYSTEQQRVIEDLKFSLGEEKVQKIMDAAIISKKIEGARNAFNYSTEHPEMLQGYIDNINKYAVEQLKTAYNNRIYTNMKYAMENLDDAQSKINYIHKDQVSSELVNRYLQEYPEYEEAMRPLVPLLKTKEDLFELIMSKKDSIPKDTRKNLIGLVNAFSTLSHSREEMMSSLNNWMLNNAEVLSTEVGLLNSLINENEELNQLRESTISESIEDKIKRKEENKRKREEEERKKKAEEEELKRVAEEEKKQREGLTPEELEAQDFLAASSANTTESYQKYLNTYPNGAYQQEAQAGIGALEGTNPADPNSIAAGRIRATKVLEDAKKTRERNTSEIPTEDTPTSETSEGQSKESSNIIENSTEDIDISDEVEDKKSESTYDNVEYEDIEISDAIPVSEQIDEVLKQDTNADITTQSIPVTSRDIPNDSKEPDVLLGNSMFRYDSEQVKTNGKLVPRQGKESNDSMSRFFRWMDAAGIDYQHTIDVYLSDIAATDPDVRFILVNPENNSTNDQDMDNHILTAVEYNSKIAKIYRNPGNNVVEIDGIKYLIIGKTGFNNANHDNTLRHSELENFLKTERWRYFQDSNNKGKRFYVDPTLKTKIKSIGRGYYVHQQEDDTSEQFRKVTELLEEKRNPRETALTDLKWGMVISGEWVNINGAEIEVVTPEDIPSKNGRVYLLIKAANGKYLPVLVASKSINDISEGNLKNLINSKLEELTMPDVKIQRAALEELRKRIVFNKGIKLSVNSAGVIQLSINGLTSEIDPRVPTFDKASFLNKIYSLNPLVNITASTLLDEHSLRMYDAAGALTVNIAQLHTSNADYSIYAVDTASGDMIVHDSATGEIILPSNNLLSTGLPIIPYRGHKYVKTDAGYTLDGKLVTDDWIVQKLDWVSLIMNTNPSLVKGKDEYYVLDNNPDKPVIIHYNTVNKVPKPVKSTYAKQLLAEIDNKVLQENARRALQNEEVKQQKTETVTEDTSESGIAMLDIMNGKVHNNEDMDDIDKARNGDKEAQERLKVYGIEWGTPGVYRFVSEGEVNNILEGGTYLGRNPNSGVDVTANPNPTTAVSAEYRITFKSHFDLYKDQNDTNRASMKNHTLRDGYIRGGYSIEDVAEIHKIYEDGTYEVIYTAPTVVEQGHIPVVTVLPDRHKNLSEMLGFGINISELIFDDTYGERFEEILNSKGWKDLPTDSNLLETYLLSKNLDTSNVTDIETFLDMLENCR